ncbi:hypothetical protein GMLC_14500 [Geomonas limicola]|uniref:Uncharacterized protein n=1 Tax=Geomonas limicola TaxID=2740186 RepID=A0A6V8N5Y0_9BACT|nr:hypothetical protein [Geomonas limicola]GFO67871.1 hypothetical protein GMLC_14500 [Geomonas limicola]
MERIDSVDGLFHEGNSAAGQKGTKVTAVWLNALQEEVISRGGSILTSDVEAALDETHGILFANPAEGITVRYHIPAYATVGALKRFKVKNIGQGTAEIDASDAKTIDGDLVLTLAPGDRCEIVKDGTNWQTI